MRLLVRFSRALALLLALAVVFLSSCAPSSRRDDFAYAAAPFSLSVAGTYLPARDPSGTPRPFAATVTAGAPLFAADPAVRDLTVVFTEPASLNGVTVTAKATPASDGTAVRSVAFVYPSDYGTVEVAAKGEEFDGLLRFAEALLPMGDVAEVSPRAEDGSHTVTRRTADGTREAVFAFAEGQVFPTRVTLTDGRGRVEMTVLGVLEMME